MRAILIDPFARTVEQIDVAPGIEAIYEAIGCDCFCTVNLDEGDAVFLDDDGLSREGQEFFAIGYYPHPLAGKGLVLGCDDEGESRSPRCTAEEMRAAIHWLTAPEAVKMNHEASVRLHAHAAIENARDTGAFHVIHAPLLEIDEDTGKARAE